MSRLAYKNIFDAVTSDQNEAADLEFRADMMIAMRQYFEDRGWNQVQIAARLGISQPRVSELVNGRIHTLSSDKLIGYLAKIGFRIKPVYKASTSRRESSISCNIEACSP
jgi:predicted XRE-type DNA-binding protein